MRAFLSRAQVFPSAHAEDGAPKGRISGLPRQGALSVATFLVLTGATFAQTTTPAPTITTGQPQASFGQKNGAVTIKLLLNDSYEIKTGFIDPNGGAYLALQKGTSAYFCHSNPTPTCEKLN